MDEIKKPSRIKKSRKKSLDGSSSSSKPSSSSKAKSSSSGTSSSRRSSKEMMMNMNDTLASLANNPLAASSPKMLKKKKKKKLDVETTVASAIPSSTEQVSRAKPKIKVPKEQAPDVVPVVAEPVEMNTMATPKRVKSKKKKDNFALIQEEEESRVSKAEGKSAEDGKRDSSEHGGDDDNYDDDDFEDYNDDDFEDFDEDHEPSEPKPVNSFVPAKSPKTVSKNQFAPELRSKRSKEESKTASAGKFTKVARSIPKPRANSSRQAQRDSVLRSSNLEDFEAMDDLGIVVGSHSLQQKRCKELKKVVKLQQSKIDIFEQHSLPPWEYYIRTVGAGGTHRQTFTQTNDDACEMAIQTEPIETREFYCDGDDFGVVEMTSANEADRDALLSENETKTDGIDNGGEESKHSSGAGEAVDIDLNGIHKLVQTMEIVLEENIQANSAEFGKSGKEDKKKRNKSGQAYLASSSTNLSGLKDRPIADISFSALYSNILLTAHGPSFSETTDDANRKKSLICIWDINKSTEEPQMILICESMVTKCLFSPRRSTIVIGGCDDGAIFVWDLRNHVNANLDKNGLPCYIMPSYSTAGLTNGPLAEKMHMSTICDMVLVKSSLGGPSGRSASSMVQDIGFQFASLDDRGDINIWTVLDHNDNNSGGPALSSMEQGVFLGGRVKLHHVSTVHGFDGSDAALKEQSLATSLAFHPTDLSQIFVSLSDGKILHTTRFGKAVPPRVYKPGNGLNLRFCAIDPLLSGLSVTCIRFNPFFSNYFLAGYSNGNLALFDVHNSLPLKTWEMTTEMDAGSGSGFSSVLQVAWSSTCPTIFFVLDKACCVHVWDLTRDQSKPILSEKEGESKSTLGQNPFFTVSSCIVKTMPTSLAVVDAAMNITVHHLSSDANPPQPLHVAWTTGSQKENQGTQQNGESFSTGLNEVEEIFLNLF